MDDQSKARIYLFVEVPNSTIADNTTAVPGTYFTVDLSSVSEQVRSNECPLEVADWLIDWLPAIEGDRG